MGSDKKIDVNFFRPFIDGTRNVLKVQCNLDITHEKPFIKGTRAQPDFEIAGIIGITSTVFTGTITICFPAKVYLKIMSNMLGEEFTEISRDLEDGAAELMNIIFGSAKVVLNEQGYAIQKAIPTVIAGSKLRTSHMGKGSVMVLPFQTAVGEFHIEIVTEGISMAM